jgi:hypothetical protein
METSLCAFQSLAAHAKDSAFRTAGIIGKAAAPRSSVVETAVEFIDRSSMAARIYYQALALRCPG